MPKVTVMPSGVEFDAQSGECVMGAARRHGYCWPTICDMLGECGVCHLQVLDSPGALSAREPQEAQTLAVVEHRYSPAERQRLRLACVARVDADVIVFKRGVRPVTPR